MHAIWLLLVKFSEHLKIVFFSHFKWYHFVQNVSLPTNINFNVQIYKFRPSYGTLKLKKIHLG